MPSSIYGGIYSAVALYRRVRVRVTVTQTVLDTPDTQKHRSDHAAPGEIIKQRSSYERTS